MGGVFCGFLGFWRQGRVGGEWLEMMGFFGAERLVGRGG